MKQTVKLCHDMKCVINNESGYSIAEILPSEEEIKSPSLCCLRFDDNLLELGKAKGDYCNDW